LYTLFYTSNVYAIKLNDEIVHSFVFNLQSFFF
jgi:hypothetical protein